MVVRYESIYGERGFPSLHALGQNCFGIPEKGAECKFEQMRPSLQLHLISLAGEKRLLEEANRRLQETQQQLIQTERLAAVGTLAA